MCEWGVWLMCEWGNRCCAKCVFLTPSCWCRCGHCKSLAPHWASAATELKGKYKLGAMDATVHTVMSSRYGIQGFPTIKYFPAGKKASNSAVDYDGGRTSSDIVQWALSRWTENLPPPEVYQVSNYLLLQLCLLSVYPSHLDHTHHT